MIGRRTNNHDILLKPFLHKTLSNQVQRATYNNLTAKNAKLWQGDFTTISPIL